MDEPDGAGASTPLQRARPPQVLLGVGAVLLVTAGATAASINGGAAAQWFLIGLTASSASLSLGAASRGLRSSEETFAACSGALGLVATGLGGRGPATNPVPALVLTAVFLGLHLGTQRTVGWPLASWAAGQLAVLRGLHLVPSVLHTGVVLSVTLVGLGIALFARPLIARIALLTSAPWWLVGVLSGTSSAWVGRGFGQWLSAGLMIAAGFGLVPARLRKELDPLLGPPRAVPVVAGLVSGAATAGALSSLGPLAMTLTGFVGVLITTIPAGYLTGWHRGLFLPAALAAGITMTLLCVVQLLAAARWSDLCLLLVLTSIPTVLVAVRRPEDRPEAVPTAVGCLAGAVLLALPDGLLRPALAAALLTALYGAAMAVGSALAPVARKTTAVAAAGCAVAAVVVVVARGSGTALAVHLAVQGVCTLGWAVQTGRHPEAATAGDGGNAPASGGWRVGALQLLVAAWIFAAAAGLGAVEWYTLPTAGALLLGAGPRLVRGPSWPAWGPGLLVAAVPSALVDAARPEVPRSLLLLVAAAVAMVAGSRSGIRAPLLVGAGTALSVTLGLAVRQVPWPLGTALIVGSALLMVGMFRERWPIAGFGTRLADLR